MSLFNKKYLIQSNRLPGWDYTHAGYYFITICVDRMQCVLGKIDDQGITLSDIGKIVAEEWIKTECIRSYVNLDQWVIMPNHFHAIIRINERKNVEMTRRVISTLSPNSLGSIIGQFKSQCTKRIRSGHLSSFQWQRNYHDHIIRDEKSLESIRQYILNNPLKWDLDEYHPSRK